MADCSAGVKNCVKVETKKVMHSNPQNPVGAPQGKKLFFVIQSKKGMLNTKTPRRIFELTKTVFLFQRSTYTPAIDPNKIAGIVNDTMTAETHPLIVSPLF